MEEDRLVRRLGSGHAGEVFEAVIGGRVYALKLFTHPEKYNSESYAYAKLNIALIIAKEKAASEPSKSAATAKPITVYSFCQQIERCLTQRVLRNYGGPTKSCFLSHAVQDYWHVGLQLEMLDGPTLDDGDNGLGAVTTVLKTEGQRRRVWERLRGALKWLHEEAEIVHGSVHGRNIILVRVADRMGKMEDEKKSGENGSEEVEISEQGGEEEEEEDYMPVLIDFNRADMKEKSYTEEGWRLACLSELDMADRLLPMVALKDMRASRGKMIKSDDGCEKAKASVCGTCLVCLWRRLDRLKNTVRGVLGYEGFWYARWHEEIVQPIFADTLHVVTGIIQDIEQNTEPGNGMGALKSLAEELVKELLWSRWVELPCAGNEVFRTLCGF